MYRCVGGHIKSRLSRRSWDACLRVHVRVCVCVRVRVRVRARVRVRMRLRACVRACALSSPVRVAVAQLEQILPPGGDTVWLQQFLLVSFGFVSCPRSART